MKIPGKNIISSVKARLGTWVFRRAAKSKRFAVIYYCLFSRAFHWELFSTACAVHRYVETLNSGKDRSFLLRRNIHRLEKALLMRPRRESFALNYIEETVRIFCSRVETFTEVEVQELKWASEVLAEYFDCVKSDDPAIVNSRKKFLEAKAKLNCHGTQKFIPYFRNLETELPVTIESLQKLAFRRRSVRWYLPKPVPQELIEQALEVASQSPSACNRQPFEFRIFNDPAMARSVAEIAPGTAGFVHNIQAVAVVVGRLDAYFSERDRHLIYIDSALASMSFMLALETLNLSSCPLNWPDQENLEKKMAKKIGLKPYERTIMLISFGYPDPEGMVAYSQKKPPSDLSRFNKLRLDT